MSNKFYQTGDQRAAKVNDLFATIAPRYDLINDLQSFWMHRWWKRRLLKLAAVKPGETALDLCCGTGDVAFALESRGAIVTGLDFSAGMLSVAAQRAAAHPGGSTIRFIQGDALVTGLPDASFDVVTISYGLRNLADWRGGLKEMCRLAKPGARLLVLDFGKPDFGPWRAVYMAYLKWVVPRFGRWFFRDSDTHGYIHESLLHYPAQRGVEAEMKAMGLEAVRVVNLMGGMMGINVARKPTGVPSQN